VWSRLASAVRDRLVLMWLAGAAVWLAWLVSLALGGWRHDLKGHRLGADHVQYYVVGELVNEGASGLLYEKSDPGKVTTMERRQKEIGGEGWEGYLPFRYPPFYALLYAPTSRLSYEASFLIWTVVALAGLVLSGYVLGVHLRDWLIGALCFYPVFAAVSFGQNSLLSLLLISIVAALWLRDRPLLAGLVAGLLLYKPQLAIGIGILWIFDIRNSWRALIGMAVTGAVLVAVAWLAMPEACRVYFGSLGDPPPPADRMALAPLYSSQAFWQLLLSARLDSVAGIFALLTSVIGLVVFAVLWWRWRQRRAAAFALSILVTPWLTPYLMVYDWSVLLVPAVLLVREMSPDRRVVLAALLWLAALVSGPLVIGQLTLSPIALQVSMPALIFAVLALGLPVRTEDRPEGPVTITE